MLVEPERTKADLQWSLLGIPVRVHPLFWVTCMMLGWHGPGTRLPDLMLWTACVFLAILVHEFGHALTARGFGVRDGRVVLYALGGLAIHTSRLDRKRRVAELLMGPGAGFLLYGLLWVLTQLVFDTSTWPARAHDALRALEVICVGWGLLNLLPVYPLDGGQISRELFEARRPRDGFRLSLILSAVVALLAAGGFVAWMLHAGQTDVLGLLPALLFVFLAFQSGSLARQLGQRGGGSGGEGAWEEPRQPWERDPDWWRGGRG